MKIKDLKTVDGKPVKIGVIYEIKYKGMDDYSYLLGWLNPNTYTIGEHGQGYDVEYKNGVMLDCLRINGGVHQARSKNLIFLKKHSQ